MTGAQSGNSRIAPNVPMPMPVAFLMAFALAFALAGLLLPRFADFIM